MNEALVKSLLHVSQSLFFDKNFFISATGLTTVFLLKHSTINLPLLLSNCYCNPI